MALERERVHNGGGSMAVGSQRRKLRDHMFNHKQAGEKSNRDKLRKA